MTKRPTMPEPVKRAVLYRNLRKHHGRLVCEETGGELTEDDILSRRLHFDHVPPLALRYKDDDGNYHPSANDPNHIEICSAVGHIHRTSKRRGLFRGDQTEIAKSRRIRLSSACHKQLMKAKVGLEPAVTPEELLDAFKNAHKRKIEGRGFDKTMRKRMDGTVEKRK